MSKEVKGGRAIVKREDITELQCIMPIENLPLVMQHGILSHKRAKKVSHHSVALEDVQNRRRSKRVPGGRPLHDYANLYFHARNPMMFKRKAEHRQLSILRISPKVLDIPGVVVTDMNAARGIARFMPAMEGLAALDDRMVFAEDWRHPGDYAGYERHQGVKCAEVLVPDAVPPTLILGVYVSCGQSKGQVESIMGNVSVKVNAHLFFAD